MESFYHCTRPTLLAMTWYYIMIFTPVFTCTSSCSMFLLELIQSWNINAKGVKRLWNGERKQTEYMFSECECVFPLLILFFEHVWCCIPSTSAVLPGCFAEENSRTTAYETIWMHFTHKPTSMVLCCFCFRQNYLHLTIEMCKCQVHLKCFQP